MCVCVCVCVCAIVVCCLERRLFEVVRGRWDWREVVRGCCEQAFAMSFLLCISSALELI